MHVCMCMQMLSKAGRRRQSPEDTLFGEQFGTMTWKEDSCVRLWGICYIICLKKNKVIHFSMNFCNIPSVPYPSLILPPFYCSPSAFLNKVCPIFFYFFFYNIHIPESISLELLLPIHPPHPHTHNKNILLSWFLRLLRVKYSHINIHTYKPWIHK